MSGAGAAEPARLARLALARVVEPGTRSVYRAVSELGPEEVWSALRAGRPAGPISTRLAAAAAGRAEGYQPERDWERLLRLGGRYLQPGDPEWPEELLRWDGELGDAPPLGLCVRGPARLDRATERSVALVGARAATAYGLHVSREFGFGLAERGWTVVSGAAYGIDGAAHRGALASGTAPTIAVLGCGVDVSYPRGHQNLLGQIAATGLVVSEWPPGATPTRARFLVRNRVIAALSAGTVVVEAGLRSGSLATACRAQQLSRTAMAVPGPVTSSQSAGCHELLRAPEPALCVTRVEEVLEAVGRLGTDLAEPRASPGRARDGLSEVVCRVLDAVPVRPPAGEASIARAAGVSSLTVQQVLPSLLLAGLVERAPEGWRLTALGMGDPAALTGPARRGAAP